MKLLIVDSTVIKNICKDIPSIDDLREDCVVLVTEEGYISYRESGVPSFKISPNTVDEILFQCKERLYQFQLFILFPELQIVNYYMTSKAKLVIYALLTSSPGSLFTVKDLSDRLSIPWKDADIIVDNLISIGYVIKYHSSKKVTSVGFEKMKEELKQYTTDTTKTIECKDAIVYDNLRHPNPKETITA